MNQFQCVATFAERDAVRYTPAGIPILSAKLLHSSQQLEAGIQRLVEFEISAIAAGKMCERLDREELGAVFHFTGFLARRNRNSRSLVFHITEFENIQY
ncbi:primosomal replication protein N [Oxalobacteraceae bacterium R-40]|uniref:Replication restart protein PriB n=1 Tax=Keguizhuia sedimenti TaxID=3064264 RepID=A0ABU1BUS6_9BURK|nr:primosomal replication protein N [Oxalobacteraceae bacterium R-40]